MNRNAPRQLVPQDRNNFAPRVGFAFQLTPKTVIRSGYGVFYSSYEAGPLSIPNPGNNPPFFLESNWNQVNFVTPNPIVSQLSGGLPQTRLHPPWRLHCFPSTRISQPLCSALEFWGPTRSGMEYRLGGFVCGLRREETL